MKMHWAMVTLNIHRTCSLEQAIVIQAYTTLLCLFVDQQEPAKITIVYTTSPQLTIMNLAIRQFQHLQNCSLIRLKEYHELWSISTMHNAIWKDR